MIFNIKYILYIIIIILIIFIILNKILKKNNNLNIIKKYDNAILYFNQDWTDIFNCLALINYYSNKYFKLYVVVRDDAIEIYKFYTKNLNNIQLITFPYKLIVDTNKFNIECRYIMSNINIKNSDYLFHGSCDEYRAEYKYNWIINIILNSTNFVNNYYLSYNIPISTRIDYFIFSRDYELENSTYNNFIKENGEKYILYHSNDNDDIDFIEFKKNKRYINLNQKSNTFFDYIKILENAIEIHVIDSSWGAFIYLLDAKYNLFKNKKVYLYAIRGYTKMFQEPIKLDNWTFVKINFFNIKYSKIYIKKIISILKLNMITHYIKKIFN